MRPPSLYVYFDSKNALYDALFARGAQGVLDAVLATEATVFETAATLDEALLSFGTAMVRWAVENPVYSQLLFWRPVPGFEPTAQAYAPAIELIERGRSMFAALQSRAWIRADVPPDQILRDWTIVTAGTVSQQLSNAPEESFETGSFTAALPSIVAMFSRHYATTPSATKKPTTRARGARHAHQR
jgi:AcrR family transcriptional regulator